jgi:hypothetical protein
LENIKNILTKPASESRPWAIWIWNSCISKEKLVQQLNQFIEKGFGGICIKPSRDMMPAYMSEEFLHLFQIALEISQKSNIGIRLSEDFSLPWSGVFESVANQDKKFRAQCLHLEHTEIINGKKPYERTVVDPDTAIVVIAKLVNGKVVCSQSKKLSVAPDKNLLSIKSLSGDWQLMIFRRKDVVDSVSGFIPNVFNPNTAQWYINNVGEIFKKHFSKYFHTTFKGFLHELPAYTVAVENSIPWDDDVATKYQSKYKKRLIDQLPGLFFQVETDQLKNRPAIYSFINQLVHEQFTSVIEKWCVKNRVTQWVLCPERSLQKNSSGLRICASVPDHGTFTSIGIQNQEGGEENYPLLRAVSDGNTLQFRRETVAIIGRNRLGSAATLQQLKAEVDRSILFGAQTAICLDGCFFNIDRRSYIKTPHNPFWYSPNWDFMKAFCEYATRAIDSTRRHHFVRTAAMLNPLPSILADYSLLAPEQAQKAATLLHASVRELERLNVDFDIVGQELLLGCSVFTTGEFAPANKIRKGNYRAVIVPYARLIPSGVLAFLEKFAQKDGMIIFVEEPPQGTLEDGTTATFASRLKKLLQSKKGNVRVVALKDFESFCAPLASKISISILGRKCPDILSAHSVGEGVEMLHLHNSSETRDYFASVEISGHGGFYVVDCTKGEVFEIQEVQKKDDSSRINLTFLPKQTYFIVSSSQKAQITPSAKGKKPLINTIGALQRSYCIVLKDQWQFTPYSLNMLPLANWTTRIGLSREFGGYSLFYEAYFEVKDIPDNCVMALGGLAGAANRNRAADKPMEVAVNGTRASEIFLTPEVSDSTPSSPVEAQASNPLQSTPVMHDLFGANTYVYDIKDHLRKGVNRISLRTMGLVFDPPTIAYPPVIAGTFCIIKGASGWILSVASPVAGHDSWTKYGYPYLSGAGIYKQVFELPGEYNRLVLRFSQVSDSIDVTVNEKPLGILNWHPMEVDITDVCETRRNELSVRVVNTIDNVLRMNGRPSGLMGEVYVDVY